MLRNANKGSVINNFYDHAKKVIKSNGFNYASLESLGLKNRIKFIVQLRFYKMLSIEL